MHVFLSFCHSFCLLSLWEKPMLKCTLGLMKISGDHLQKCGLLLASVPYYFNTVVVFVVFFYFCLMLMNHLQSFNHFTCLPPPCSAILDSFFIFLVPVSLFHVLLFTSSSRKDIAYLGLFFLNSSSNDTNRTHAIIFQGFLKSSILLFHRVISWRFLVFLGKNILR